MTENYIYKPFKFYLITFLMTWICWFYAAFLSFQKGMGAIEGTLMGFGLMGPLAAALIMVFGSKNSELKRDFKNKLLNCRLIKPAYIPVIILFLPIVLVISTFFSLLAGQSVQQLRLTADFNIMVGHPIISLIIPFLAPALEELGWSGYGIDSLKKSSNLLASSVLFGVIWAVWHLPLFFIKDYYHYNLLQENVIYAVNFFVSVIPMTIITNWLYYKNNRSIIAAIIFHAVVVVSSEAFQVVNLTKCIETVVLAVISVIIVMSDKRFFFNQVKPHALSVQKAA